MKAKRSKLHQSKLVANGVVNGVAGSKLLDLPGEVLLHVLGMLGRVDLWQLLQTSKATARAVMLHRSGKLTLRLRLQKAVNMAAIKKLLQWAPPSCLKLALMGMLSRQKKSQWHSLSTLFCASKSKRASAHGMLHLPCIMEVYVQGFTLPALVPIELAAACPNLQTLKLSSCQVQDGIDNNFSKSSSHSASTRAAEHLHTLILDRVDIPQLEQLPVYSASVTRHMQPAAAFADRLRISVPNLTCLKLFTTNPVECVIAPLACVLKELHLPWEHHMAWLRRPNMVSMLQGLHKLVLPCASITSSDDMDLLLSLRNLTHVELGAVHGLRQDYSSHACKWRYLKLDGDIFPESLAKLPLQSLTQPLTLCDNLVTLPVTQSDVTALQRVCATLLHCGVRLPMPFVAWQCQEFTTSGLDRNAFTAIAPAFGLHPQVTLMDFNVDQPFMEALAAVYGASLEELMLTDCEFEADMVPAWHAVLMGCPNLEDVKLSGDEHTDSLVVVSQLAAAMAQQPAGRCIEVTFHTKEGDAAACVREGAGGELQGVEVITMHQDFCEFDSASENDYIWYYATCLQITALHV